MSSRQLPQIQRQYPWQWKPWLRLVVQPRTSLPCHRTHKWLGIVVQPWKFQHIQLYRQRKALCQKGPVALLRTSLIRSSGRMHG
ncbi:hypothetical protein DPMN_132718 [Dreissena polymorpha]|uniref:Uncharacterized protein n=1 Tax=Dreissena polymorpha TaxID=45954 RepID=A0A9D4FWH4_DREPO|nr:hypothetical protein DPMN_132718 [Dreissena polymorpha]